MASYRFGVKWIAETDEPADLDPSSVAGYVSTLLLADLFDRDPAEVASDIVCYRMGEPTDRPQRTRESNAEASGYQVAIHGGLRGFNPYRPGKVFGADLHRAWSRGYDLGREILARNEQLPMGSRKEGK